MSERQELISFLIPWGGGRAENNEGDTLEGVIVHDDDTRGCAQS
jgi:hypothetical protein